MTASLQFVVPTSDLHGGIRIPIEMAEWLADSGWVTRVVGPGPRPDWHQTAVPWFTCDLEGPEPVPPADVTIATFHTTVAPALASGSSYTFHLCQGYEGLFPEYADIKDAIDTAYREPIPKLVVSHHLETVLAENYPDIRCHSRPRRHLLGSGQRHPRGTRGPASGARARSRARGPPRVRGTDAE